MSLTMRGNLSPAGVVAAPAVPQRPSDPAPARPRENWESGEDLDADLSAPHLVELAARIPELLDERGLTVNRVRRIA